MPEIVKKNHKMILTDHHLKVSKLADIVFAKKMYIAY
jgi:hypothetical protein